MGIIQPPLFAFDKRCSNCQNVLPTSEFHRSSVSAAGLSPLCKDCSKAYQREYRRKRYAESQEYRDHCRFVYKLKKYGITREQYETQLALQGGVCAICRQPDTSKKGYHVDHDHETGVVRGILCTTCNSGLGHFKDDPTILAAAIDYLRQHGK